MTTKKCSSGKFLGDPWIRRIIGGVHPGNPDNEAIAYFKSRLRRGLWRSMSATHRRQVECEIKRITAERFRLYFEAECGSPQE